MGVTIRLPDLVVGVVTVLLLFVGLGTAWQTYQRAQAVDGMMGPMGRGTLQTTQALWYLLGTVLVVAIIVGIYIVIRDRILELLGEHTIDFPVFGLGRAQNTREETIADSDRIGTTPTDANLSSILTLLPDDERRVLEPVIDSPGITQAELRDRADFSKSKISQTVSELEDRELLYRERHGRTYQIYPSIEGTDSDRE